MTTWSVGRSASCSKMSARCSGGATTKMRSFGMSSWTRSTVSWSSVRSPTRSRNCLGLRRRESGHRRVPAPPDRMRAYSLGTLPTEVVELHRVADLMDRLLGLAPRALAPRDEDLVDEPCPRGQRRSTLADRRKERLEGREQPSLDLDVADPPLAVALLELVDLGLVRVEDVVIDEDRVALDRARIGHPDPLRVGVHAHHLALDGLWVVAEIDRVIEALPHLLAAIDAG